ncbi:hypothetical protein [Streptomyces sp. MAR4 CNX-425]|uniref:hypothetical protein n=1 Tax=Streptomyces sp. MAR4 CNX-425 TaxID=3406343 RepID=UPI003B50DEA3
MLVDDALATTFDEVDSVTSTHRTLTDGSTVMRRSVVDGEPQCHMHVSDGRRSIDLLLNDSGRYTRGNEEAFRWTRRQGADVTPEQIEERADRWVKRSNPLATDLLREDVCDPKAQRTILEEKLLAPKNLKDMEKQDGAVNGQETTKLIFSGGPDTVEVHIAAEGPPYLLKVVERGGGIWTFSDFDEPYRAETPAESISEDELSGQAVDLV